MSFISRFSFVPKSLVNSSSYKIARVYYEEAAQKLPKFASWAIPGGIFGKHMLFIALAVIGLS